VRDATSLQYNTILGTGPRCSSDFRGQMCVFVCVFERERERERERDFIRHNVQSDLETDLYTNSIAEQIGGVFILPG